MPGTFHPRVNTMLRLALLAFVALATFVLWGGAMIVRLPYETGKMYRASSRFPSAMNITPAGPASIAAIATRPSKQARSPGYRRPRCA